MSRGILVFFIQNRCFVPCSKTNSMPSLAAIEFLNISPRSLSSAKTDASTLSSTIPSLRSKNSFSNSSEALSASSLLQPCIKKIIKQARVVFMIKSIMSALTR